MDGGGGGRKVAATAQPLLCLRDSYFLCFSYMGFEWVPLLPPSAVETESQHGKKREVRKKILKGDVSRTYKNDHNSIIHSRSTFDGIRTYGKSSVTTYGFFDLLGRGLRAPEEGFPSKQITSLVCRVLGLIEARG